MINVADLREAIALRVALENCRYDIKFQLWALKLALRPGRTATAASQMGNNYAIQVMTALRPGRVNDTDLALMGIQVIDAEKQRQRDREEMQATGRLS